MGKVMNKDKIQVVSCLGLAAVGAVCPLFFGLWPCLFVAVGLFGVGLALEVWVFHPEDWPSKN